MTTPLISIITVVYNGAATFENTIRSVIQQTYDSWEYIVIDGGSKDGTLDIVQRYRQHITKFVSQPDKGVYDAMNKGIRMAAGEWVFFLGSDDTLKDVKVLSDVFAGSDHTGFDLLYGNVVSPSYNGPYDGVFSFEKLLKRNISHQAIFYKRSLFDRIGDYNLQYRAHADWDLNIRCFADSRVRTKYFDRIIAEFGAEGISAHHDIPFLKEVLIPQKLKMLENTGIRRLRSLPAYDEWWRVLRNAGIRDQDQLAGLSRAYPIPRSLKNMIRWQQLVPPQTLRIGILSKSLMFASYLLNFLTGSI